MLRNDQCNAKQLGKGTLSSRRLHELGHTAVHHQPQKHLTWAALMDAIKRILGGAQGKFSESTAHRSQSYNSHMTGAVPL